VGAGNVCGGGETFRVSCYSSPPAFAGSASYFTTGWFLAGRSQATYYGDYSRVGSRCFNNAGY
jgi:hypothetical protein